jgi:hypothetical protein
MEWAELVAHVARRYVVDEVTPSSLELWWDFRDSELAVRQHQAVSRAGAHYVVACELGVPRSAWAALRTSAIRFGTLVEDGDRRELRAYLPVAGLGREMLEHALRAVAGEAARIALALAHRGDRELAADGAAIAAPGAHH